MSKSQVKYRRGHPVVLLVCTVLAILAASLPVSAPVFAQWQLNRKLNSQEYKQVYGLWETIDLPEEFRLNTIHGALLPTGKVLLVAGSGNNRESFNRFNDEGQIKVLKTAVFNPDTRDVKLVSTPSDLFCSGHAFLQSGSLLVAGGTSGYELLEGEVTKPAGQMVIHNEDPDSQSRLFKKGTRFTSPRGKVYLSTQDVTVRPAHKVDHGMGNAEIHRSSAKVFVEAEAADNSYITDKNEQYAINGLTGKDRQNIYGQGGPMSLNKQDYRGDNKAYEFDPVKEEYVRVGNMKESRWYPSLPVLTNGSVLAVSGLDNAGIITETTELYDPSTRQWGWSHNRALPTYPALFRTQGPDVLFFSGSSAGYGPADRGRDPGFWNIKDNSFWPVAGLRDPNILETSGSVMLPPRKGSNDGSQSQRIMVAGGGGIGESPLVTARTDIIDLADPTPRYTPGPDMPEALRYINLTVTPWDEVFASGGSHDYRAKGDSYSTRAFSINPTTNQITPMADEIIGRSYHAGSLLLPDGRILVFGDDPLFADKDNATPGKFQQSLEIFTPPQFFRSERPELKAPNSFEAARGQRLTFQSPDADKIKTVRLIPPSTSTHVTNLEQHSIAAIATSEDDQVHIDLPGDKNTMPNGWYMMFVVSAEGVPAQAKMIKIVN